MKWESILEDYDVKELKFYQWWCVVKTVVRLTFSSFTAAATVSGATGSTIAASFVTSSTIKIRMFHY